MLGSLQKSICLIALGWSIVLFCCPSSAGGQSPAPREPRWQPAPLPDLRPRPHVRTAKIQPPVAQSPPASAQPANQRASVAEILSAGQPIEFHKCLQPLTRGESTALTQFDPNHPPVVLLIDTGLSNQLMTPQQFKQWMNRLPSPDATTAPVDRQDRHVQQTGFWQDEQSSQESTNKFTDADKSPASPDLAIAPQQSEFEKQLAAIEKRINSRRRQFTEDQSLDESSRTELLNQLAVASQQYQQGKSDLLALTTETVAEKDFDRRLAEQQAALDKERQLEVMGVDSKLKSPDRLKEALHKQEIQLQVANDQQTAVREQLTQRESRLADLPSQRNDVDRELAKVQQEIDDLKQLPEGPNRTTQSLLLDARKLAAEIKESLLTLEVRRQDQLGKLLPLQQEQSALQIKRLEIEVESYRGKLDLATEKALRIRRSMDEQALEEGLTQRTEVLRVLAEENDTLTERTTLLINDGRKLSRELKVVKDQNAEVERGYVDLKRQLETLGKTASGIRLIEHRRGLISTGKSRSRLSELNLELQNSRTALFKLKEVRERLLDGEEILQEVTNQQDIKFIENANQQWRATEIAKRLLATQKTYVDQLIDEYDAQIMKLSSLEREHLALVNKVQQVKAFSDENAMWVRSAEPVAIEDVGRCQRGAANFFNRSRWLSLANRIIDRLAQQPYDIGFLALFAGALILVQRQLRWSHE